MGSILSVIFRAISPSLAEQAKYIYELDDNLKVLITAIVELEAKSRDVQNEVEIQERQGLQPLAEVLLWISRVEAIGPKVCRLLDSSSVELQRLFMCGFCSNDFGFSHPYGKKVFKALEEVKLLLSSKPGEVVARRGPPPFMMEGPTRHTIGLEQVLESTWAHLLEDEVGILGIYGMGGVGKTTLLDQINNRYFETRTRDELYVISVVVSQDLRIGTIQTEIGKRLGIHNTEWEKEKTKKEKASDIKRILRMKRFVLLLDDIWSKVDLEDIGVPLPSKENKSKVVFTTRSKVVCGRMGAHIEMEVKCLEPEFAWELFKEKVRASTLESDREILKLARIVCGKCKGLPLALTIIGETMAHKRTVMEWKQAIDVLDSNAAKYQEVELEVLNVLKLSYDYLKDETVKQCFQYCALFPEDHRIDKILLVDYWICEEFINGGENREKDIMHGYEIISTLINACLLSNYDEYEAEVKMHDVIRQMALWIASNFGEEKENFVVKSGARLHQMPYVRDWSAVSRMSLYKNEIRDISVTQDCSNFKTLILRENKLEHISSEFFQSMPKLLVLDLSENEHLSKLPEEVSNLVSLRYLGLAGTTLHNLPEGLTKMIQLRYLDLTGVQTLTSISILPSLVKLETLHLGFICLTLDLIEDIKSLKYLKVLSVRIDDFVVLENLLSIPRLARCIEGLYLTGMRAIYISFSTVMATLRRLMIQGCEIFYVMEDNRFQQLSFVHLTDVRGIKDLTWLLSASNLSSLLVSGTLELQEIISRGKDSGIMKEEGSSMIPFAKLRVLYLAGLMNLNSIYWEPLEFPNLDVFIIDQCRNLKKLPLNIESGKRNGFHLYVDTKEWLEKLEWEDEATKDRFVSLSEVIKKKDVAA